MARGKKRPTISDVARLSDVSAATVSRVLNGKTNFSVSDAVRERIEAVALEIGYVPDLAARNLNRRQTKIVGVFAHPETNLSEGISEQLLEGVAGVFHPAGYEIFYQLTSAHRHAQPVPFWRFDGAVLMQAPLPETVEQLRRRRVPYVCVNEQADGAIANVLADDEMGCRKVLDHLRQLGHRKVAYIDAPRTYLPHYSAIVRRRSLRAEADARGMTIVGTDKAAPSDARQFLERAVGKGATAAICYDHQLAVITLSAAAGLGLAVPDDLSLVCFNDLFPVSLLPMPLTAVAVNGRAIGRAGAEMLLATLQNSGEGGADESPSEAPAPAPETAEIVLSPEDLIVRGSTAPPAAGALRPE